MAYHEITTPDSVIDPVTRIEGHLRLEITKSGGVVDNANCVCEMFRGFENVLVGHAPQDAVQITQRI